MDEELERSHPKFIGNWEDLRQFLQLTASPIRSPLREDALRTWEDYKLKRQLAAPRQLTGKGSYIQALVLRVIDLRGANFDGICLGYADLRGVIFDGCSMRGAWLKGVKLENASLRRSDFSSLLSNGHGAGRLLYSDLCRTDFSEANLSGVDLSFTALNDATLSKASLTDANLERATLVRASIDGACLKNTRVYGISAWDLRGQPAVQQDLVITPSDQTPVSVDNLKVAQFIYLLMNNPEIREVIDTVTTKAVLILGRFTDTRKQVLEALRSKIRGLGLVPILFDFPPSEHRDLTETVQLLANMARFVVADLTDAKSIPQELSHIIPHLPSVPVQPIVDYQQEAYSMYEHWKRFQSVLPLIKYKNKEDLADVVAETILRQVQTWEHGVDQVAQMEAKIKELESQLEHANHLKS